VPLCAFYAAPSDLISILCTSCRYALGSDCHVRIRHPAPGRTMIDILLLALGVGLFGLMAAYLAGCERV
jgi:hypothetical protein